MAKYMLLIYIDPALAPAEAQHEAWGKVSQQLVEAGQMVAGDGLQGIDTATTVRVRQDERLVTDGPFAETREMLGGYYVVDVPDLDAALEWSAKMPNVGYGSVEVRPLLEM
jgi:hypothetical protein